MTVDAPILITMHDRPLTLVEHLEELRKRILFSLAALALASLISFPAASYLLQILKNPAAGLIDRLVFFSPQEAFLIYMRIAFLSGFVISLPVILYQLWAFIAPALEERFRKGAVRFIVFCFLAFILGCCFAYFVLIPPAIRFLLSFAKDELVPVISASSYVSFIVGLILGCGLIFQMPVLSFILSRLRVISASLLRRKYKYAIAVVFILAAIITPTTDILNMCFLAFPMLLLYETSIWIARLAE